MEKIISADGVYGLTKNGFEHSGLPNTLPTTQIDLSDHGVSDSELLIVNNNLYYSFDYKLRHFCLKSAIRGSAGILEKSAKVKLTY